MRWSTVNTFGGKTRHNHPHPFQHDTAYKREGGGRYSNGEGGRGCSEKAAAVMCRATDNVQGDRLSRRRKRFCRDGRDASRRDEEGHNSMVVVVVVVGGGGSIGSEERSGKDNLSIVFLPWHRSDVLTRGIIGCNTQRLLRRWCRRWRCRHTRYCDRMQSRDSGATTTTSERACLHKRYRQADHARDPGSLKIAAKVPHRVSNGKNYAGEMGTVFLFDTACFTGRETQLSSCLYLRCAKDELKKNDTDGPHVVRLRPLSGVHRLLDKAHDNNDDARAVKDMTASGTEDKICLVRRVPEKKKKRARKTRPS